MPSTQGRGSVGQARGSIRCPSGPRGPRGQPGGGGGALVGLGVFQSRRTFSENNLHRKPGRIRSKKIPAAASIQEEPFDDGDAPNSAPGSSGGRLRGGRTGRRRRGWCYGSVRRRRDHESIARLVRRCEARHMAAMAATAATAATWVHKICGQDGIAICLLCI